MASRDQHATTLAATAAVHSRVDCLAVASTATRPREDAVAATAH